jgi:hypothetical protein
MRGNKLARFVSDKLHELHPGFSASSVFDTQRVTLDQKRWLLVTVMEQPFLTEYRVLNPGAVFFTATGLLVRSPHFTEQPPHTFSTEIIGYDKETEKPVSVPRNEPENSAPDGHDSISSLLKSTPVRYGIFNKPQSPLFFVIPLVLLLAGIGIAAIAGYLKNAPHKEPVPDITEPPVEWQSLPSPFAQLADIAAIVLDTGGTIMQWNYNESADPACTIDITGSEAAQIFDAVPMAAYARLNGISEIHYTQGNPAYTVTLSIPQDPYVSSSYTLFSGQEQAFAILTSLRTGISSPDSPVIARIISETLPSYANGNALCGFLLNCEAEQFVPSLEEIEAVLAQDVMRVRQMTVSFDRQKNMFICSVFFSPIQPGPSPPRLLEEHKESIPAAFGYTAPPQDIPVVHIPPPKPEPASPDLSEYTKIGVIRGDDDKDMVYYRNKEGKIVILEE